MDMTEDLLYKPLVFRPCCDCGVDEGGLAALEGFKNRFDFRSGVEAIVLAVPGGLASGASAGSSPAFLFCFGHIKENLYLCATLQRGEAFASPFGQIPISKETLIFQILKVILRLILLTFGGFFYSLSGFSITPLPLSPTAIQTYASIFELIKPNQDNFNIICRIIYINHQA